MASRDLVLSAAGATTDKTYVEDVFSTYVYKGNGSTQTINNGIDLAGKGGMVWTKSRSFLGDHGIYDTARGATYDLASNLTSAQTTQSTGLTAFNSTGYSINTLTKLNINAETFCSWTFRKAPKFFDVVTWTGDGSASRDLTHSLGQAPGMMIVKSTSSATYNWFVWHRSFTDQTSDYMFLNTTDAKINGAPIWGSSPTSSKFTVASSAVFNATGQTYVAYLFAHDTTADGMIQCGSFTTDSGGKATVNLGWEPQYVLFKLSSGIDDWIIHDSMRGLSLAGNQPSLRPDLSSAEGNLGYYIYPNATGFSASTGVTSATYIYMAIRRPMKVPTDGTKVFQPVVRTGTGTAAVVNTTITPDLIMHKARGTSATTYFLDRLRDNSYLLPTGTASEASNTTYFPTQMWDNQTGYDITGSGVGINSTSYSYIDWVFKRAPGFFDVVCYTGGGDVSGQVLNHNLGVQPELVIAKHRSATGNWAMDFIVLDYSFTVNSIAAGYGTGWGNAPDFTATTFNPLSIFNASSNIYNVTGTNYVAYLFASCPGVSKVGMYTGNGGSQTINCGFTNGARFVLIKSTLISQGFVVYDTARGIVAGNDPYLALNSTAAEVTTDDGIDPDPTGFIVNATSSTLNVNATKYFYLAIA